MKAKLNAIKSLFFSSSVKKRTVNEFVFKALTMNSCCFLISIGVLLIFRASKRIKCKYFSWSIIKSRLKEPF